MAAAAETIKISLEFSDSGAAAVVKKLESSFRGLTNAANQLDSQGISKVRDRIKNFDTAGKRNISTIQSQIGALKALRNEAQIGSTQFKQLTADISTYSQELQKAEGRKRSGGRLAGVAKGVGAIAAGGVFGGPEGAIGGGIGLALGGPGGAAIGAAIGAQVGNIRKQAGAVAETVATFNKYQIALAGVSTNQDDFNTSIQAAKQFSEQFVVPLDTTIAQYTKLKASVVGAGLGTDETNKAFEALSASVIATGGSTEDLNSALRAASQVFSKGKVSAEELRQQIGERLPGAFTIFADSMGISTKELDKLLEQGKVTLDDFVGFTEELIRRYGTTAEELAKAPELAGARLEVAVKKAQLAFGGFFANVGAGFQDYFTGLINFALENEETLKDVIAEFVLFAENVGTIFTEIGKVILEIFGPIFKFLASEIAKFAKAISGDIVRGQRLQQYEQTYGQTSREALQRTAEQRAERRVPNPFDTAGRETARLEELDRLLVSGLGVQAGGIDRLAQIRSSLDLKMPTNFGSGLRDRVLGTEPDVNQGGGTVNEIKDITKAEADAQIAQLALRERGITLTKEQIEQAAELAREAAKALPTQKQRVKFKEIEIKAANQINQLEQEQLRTANSVSKAKIQLNKLLTKAKGESGLFTDEQLVQAENQIRLNELMLKFNILVENGVLSAEELKKKLQEALKALNKLGKEGLEAFKEKFKEGLEDMINVAPKLANVALGAISSVSDGLVEMITTGKANFKEMTASILKDIAKIMMQAAIAGAVKKIFGLADGGVIQGGRIKPYAKGGVVAAPTVFPMAGGDVGLMGEAGPEAVMPLKRGPSGRLGVEVNQSDIARNAMNRYSRRGSLSGEGAEAQTQENALELASTPTAIDVRYTVERINSVDYVTADQFQTGMQQAAQQGAKQGEQQTLKRLQMSGSTRKRIGI